MMLEVRNLAAGYRGRAEIESIDLALGEGEIVALLGANGAGKSTLAKALSGLLPALAGEIRFAGARMERLSAQDRLRRGIAHVPEGRQVFAGMTVRENLRLGAFLRRGRGASAEIERRIRAVSALFPMLEARAASAAGTLSGGQQQVLAIARGLMSNPRLLILDEPSLGLSPLLVAETFRLVRRLRDDGISVLLAEQNAAGALAIADRAYVLENGRVTLAGAASALLGSPEVAERYLGIGRAEAVSDEESLRIAQCLRDRVWGAAATGE